MAEKRIGLFPGSFDPFTRGHEAVIDKALRLFDEIVIGVGFNSKKSGYFPLENRITHIQKIYSDEPRISIKSYEKLTVEFAEEIGAEFIVRGLRDSKDFAYEKPIAHMNLDLNSRIETVFLLTDQKYSAINSSIVREIHKNGGNIDKFVGHADCLK